jgi:hypothetical protein
MDFPNNQSNGFPNTMPGAMPPKKEGVVGPIIGSIIIIVLLVLGALYFYGSIVEKQKTQNTPTPALSESTRVADIEADLSVPELDTVDADMAELEAEIDAAL